MDEYYFWLCEYASIVDDNLFWLADEWYVPSPIAGQMMQSECKFTFSALRIAIAHVGEWTVELDRGLIASCLEANDQGRSLHVVIVDVQSC